MIAACIGQSRYDSGKGGTLETMPILWLGSLGEMLGKVSLMDSHFLVCHGLGYVFFSS